MQKIARIYQFHPFRTPVVNYQGTMEVHMRWTQRQGHGPTYGECLWAAWRESRQLSGIVCLEHDIAVARHSWTELGQLASSRPMDVAAVPYLLYPRSTGRETAVWAHRLRHVDGTYYYLEENTRHSSEPDAFGLGCTYLPGRLLDAMPDDLRQWDYPVLDTRLSDLARELGIVCRCTQMPAVHLHY